MTDAIVVSRRYDLPAEQVFDAWITPETAKRFLFATPTGTMVRTDIDARVGGRFTFTDRRNGDDIDHVGEYLEVDRPRRLVFSFAVPKFSADYTTVAIDIAPTSGGCDLTLTHTGVLPEWTERTRQGWTKILDALAASLA